MSMDYGVIISKIEALQSPGNHHYRKGLFPSQRVHGLLPYRRQDNNIFFSALIAFTLQGISPDISRPLQDRVKKIIDGIVANYPCYQHWKGEGTYNFWESIPSGHFPYGWLLRLLPNMAIPDDADDSSLIYLTGKHSDEQRLWFKEKLENHYAPDSPSSALTPVTYQDLRAYPTFFGKKILREMDACVICNVLYFVLAFNLPFTSSDWDSLEYLNRVLRSGDYHKTPFLVSPNYGSSPLILYHLARLVTAFDHKVLINMREPLIQAIQSDWAHRSHYMDRLLLKSSMYRLKAEAPWLSAADEPNPPPNNFYFFQAGMLTALQNASLKEAAAHPFFHLRYRCSGYHWALVLEHEVLKHRYYSGS